MVVTPISVGKNLRMFKDRLQEVTFRLVTGQLAMYGDTKKTDFTLAEWLARMVLIAAANKVTLKGDPSYYRGSTYCEWKRFGCYFLKIQEHRGSEAKWSKTACIMYGWE